MGPDPHEPIHDIAHLGSVELLTPKFDRSLWYFRDVLGMEVVNRLAGVGRGVLNQCGLHPSSMLGGFGSANNTTSGTAPLGAVDTATMENPGDLSSAGPETLVKLPLSSCSQYQSEASSVRLRKRASLSRSSAVRSCTACSSSLL